MIWPLCFCERASAFNINSFHTEAVAPLAKTAGKDDLFYEERAGLYDSGGHI
jgi:hypothetical protein